VCYSFSKRIADLKWLWRLRHDFAISLIKTVPTWARRIVSYMMNIIAEQCTNYLPHPSDRRRVLIVVSRTFAPCLMMSGSC
jgi:hypothetical protein